MTEVNWLDLVFSLDEAAEQDGVIGSVIALMLAQAKSESAWGFLDVGSLEVSCQISQDITQVLNKGHMILSPADIEMFEPDSECAGHAWVYLATDILPLVVDLLDEIYELNQQLDKLKADC